VINSRWCKFLKKFQHELTHIFYRHAWVNSRS